MIDTLHSDQWDCRIIPAKKWAYSHTYIPVSLFNLLPVPTIKWCPGCISTLRSYTDLEEEEGCHQQGWICNHFKRASFTETSHQWSVYSHAKFSSQSTTNIISSWQYYIAGWGVSQPRNHNQLYWWNFCGLKFCSNQVMQSGPTGLAAQAAAVWTMEESEPSGFGSCPHGIAWK